ncbi:hypothetical protein Tco_1355380 [Tanacetum coccineum]
MHMKEVIKTYQQSSSNLLSLVEMLKEANVHGLMHTLKAIQNAINTQKVVNATPIQTIFPTTSYPTPSITHEAQVIELSSIPSHTYPIIDTTPPKDQPGSSSFITPKVDKGKGIARDTHDLPPKLIKASRKVCPNPDAPAHLDKKEKMEQAAKEAELSKLDIMKVAAKLVNEAEKKPERITNIYIDPRTRPVTVRVYRNNDQRNFQVHKEFKFSDFGLSEWGELNAILLRSQANPSLPRRKRKAIELEPETYIAGLHCN